jgi:hypothetical protein
MKKNIHVSIIIYLQLVASLNIFGQISFQDIGINTNYGTAQYGGGVSFCDFDNDGWDDLTFSSQDGDPIRFYKNNRGTYTQIFPTISDPMTASRQLTWADFDNDGDKDLVVTSLNASIKLFRNDGSLILTDITVIAGFNTDVLYIIGASWGDYNNDGYLDLFLSSRDPDQIIPNKLYKNNGNSTFTDVSISAGIKTSDGDLSFCASFFDYNNDGWQDIYVANDKVNNPNILYKNNGDGTFDDVSVASGTNLSIDAMSTTIGDYNQDGWQDIYVTNTANYNGNHLLKNNGDGTFTNVAPTTGVQFSSVAWGAVFLDADLDLDLDLYVSGMLDGSNPSLIPSAFYENRNGNYSIPISAGFDTDNATSFSNAIGDVNNDGKPDMVVVNFSPRDNFLWQNTSTTTNNWIKINLEGTSSNKDGIGSKIELTVEGNTYYNYTLSGEGYQSQNSSNEFFGLNNFTNIESIKVKWLSGTEDTYTNVGVNQTIKITEGEATLSIVNAQKSDILSVYPNPNNGKFNFEIKNKNDFFDLKIYDPLGTEVYSKKKTLNKSIDIKDLKNGVYFLNITINNGEVLNQKFVVTKVGF